MSTALLERPTVDMAAHIKAVVAEAPPLSDATMARVMGLFMAGGK